MIAGHKILVAGGTGTIGIPIVRMLCERGANVTVVATDNEERARAVLGPEVAYQRLDLTDMSNCLSATRGFDDVLNLVGIKGSVGIGDKQVASFFYPMVLFQTNLMEAAFRNSVGRYLFVSSICAYPRSSEPKREDSCWDGMPLQNDRIPGLVKRIGEVQAEAYKLQYGWDGAKVLRPSNVYGPFDDFDPATAQVIPSLIRRMVDGERPLKIWGDGSAVRDFIFSEDVAYWAIEALERAPSAVPINIGGGRGTSIAELVATLARLMPEPTEYEWNPAGPVGDPVRVLDTTRAQELLGYTVRTSLEQGLAKTVEWFRSTSPNSIVRRRPT